MRLSSGLAPELFVPGMTRSIDRAASGAVILTSADFHEMAPNTQTIKSFRHTARPLTLEIHIAALLRPRNSQSPKPRVAA
jgi:hypothetical protein